MPKKTFPSSSGCLGELRRPSGVISNSLFLCDEFPFMIRSVRRGACSEATIWRMWVSLSRYGSNGAGRESDLDCFF